MTATPPTLSICLPTYNRERLLDLCLARLDELNRTALTFEVVVSDNCSTDGTPDVVRRHAETLPSLVYHRMREHCGSGHNWQNAIRHARGEFVVYLADDDRLIAENLAAHVEAMRRNRALVATYADWICWDDRTEEEIYRYFTQFLPHRQEYSPDERLGALEFILQTPILPEIAIFRRANLLRALPSVKVGYVHLQILYHMLRQGTIAFDPLPFYVENRFVKEEYARNPAQSLGLWLINDDMRTTFDVVLLKAYQDLGFPSVPAAARERVRELIERRLQNRYHLEAGVACASGNFILASELHRRWILWRGDESPLELQAEIDTVVVPAALQAVAESFEAVSGCESVAFHGFKTPRLAEAFASRHPTIPLAGSPETAWQALLDGEWRHLHVVRSAGDLPPGALPGNVLLFDNLLDLYQTTAFAPALLDL